MAKCLVLGANGFIGSHLVDELVRAGHSVRAFDRFKSNDQIFENSDRVDVYAGDFLNRYDLEQALDDIEYVFHFISTTTPASAENDPTIDIETNIRMSVELFELCVEKNIKRLFFASTGGAIYGANQENQLHKESDLPLPVSPYAIGKLTIEHYLRYFKVKHQLDSVSLRISNPYGERQPLHRKQGVIPIFIEELVRQEPITILGDGSMVRDYVYVKDVARIVADMTEKPIQHSIYNLGSGNGVDIASLVATIESVVGRKFVIEHSPAPATYVHKVTLDTSRLTDEFGSFEFTPLQKGIQQTYNYISTVVEAQGKE